MAVRLSDDVTQHQLETMRPDTTRLPSLETTGTVRGVILTIRWVRGVMHTIKWVRMCLTFCQDCQRMLSIKLLMSAIFTINKEVLFHTQAYYVRRAIQSPSGRWVRGFMYTTRLVTGCLNFPWWGEGAGGGGAVLTVVWIRVS
jgi:hypothetical protein